MYVLLVDCKVSWPYHFVIMVSQGQSRSVKVSQGQPRSAKVSQGQPWSAMVSQG